jgi:hypothetical protein
VEWRGTVAGSESSFMPLLTRIQLVPVLGNSIASSAGLAVTAVSISIAG